MIAAGKSTAETVGHTFRALQAADHGGDIDVTLVYIVLYREAAKAR